MSRTDLDYVWVEDDFPAVKTQLRDPATGELVFTKRGMPVYMIAGGAPVDSDITEWIPIEYDSDVVMRIQQMSAIEGLGYPVPMGSNAKEIPRSGGMDAHSGPTYVDDASENDKITLHARKFTGRFSVDEDDLADANTRMNVLQTKDMDWGTSYSGLIDNAALGVSAAMNTTVDGTTHNMIAPFRSIYYVLRNDPDSLPDYAADDNYLTWDGTTLNSSTANNLYDKLSSALGKLEQGDYWEQGTTVCIADPSFREKVRNLKDNNGNPIFVDNRNLDGGRTPDMLMGVPVYWTKGARVAAKNVSRPSGHALLFFVNRTLLKRGDRTPQETAFSPSRAQDDTDSSSVKYRVRKAFELGHPRGAVVLEALA